MEKPKPIYVVHKEGGELIHFSRLRDHLASSIKDGEYCTFDQYQDNYRAHAIYFEDGSQFDLVNGWRDNPCNKPIVRVKMGRA